MKFRFAPKGRPRSAPSSRLTREASTAVASRATLLGVSVGIAFGLSAGCSLTGVADFEPGECKTDDDCTRAFNRDNGFYEDCAAFTCELKGKRRECVPLTEEICDGKDNDCDRLIDEPVDGDSIVELVRSRIGSIAEAPVRASVVDSQEFGQYVYVSSPTGETATPLGSGEPEALRMRTIPEPGGDSYGSTELSQLTKGCYLPASLESCELGSEAGLESCRTALNNRVDSCRLTETAVAATGEYALFAGVRVEQCNAGELRVGLVDGASPESLVSRGRAQRDPTYRGVHTRGSRCSSNLTAACEDLKNQILEGQGDTQDLPQVCGVSRPNVATLEQQGLVAYLGRSELATTCAADTPVLGLGLEIKSSSNPRATWTNPSGDGVPDLLGLTQGGAAPAVLSVHDQGFLVGFGANDGGVDLVWVPAQPKGPAFPSTATSFPEYEQRDGVSTAALASATLVYHIADEVSADAIALALLPIDDDETLLGVAWVEGCAATYDDFSASPLKAQLLSLQLGGEDVTLEEVGPPVELGSTTRKPLITPSEDDFVVAGFRRGSITASEGRLGGFFVTGYDKKALTYRVTAFDGQRLDTREVLAGQTTEVLLAPRGSGALLGYDTAKKELYELEFSCAR